MNLNFVVVSKRFIDVVLKQNLAEHQFFFKCGIKAKVILENKTLYITFAHKKLSLAEERQSYVVRDINEIGFSYLPLSK